MSVFLRLEAEPGTTLSEAASDLVETAARLRIPARLRFNGCDMIARPGDTAEEVLAKFDRNSAAHDRMLREQRERAAQAKADEHPQSTEGRAGP